MARTKWLSITLLAVCEVMVLALWFSVTAVIPALRSEFAFDDTQTSLFTSGVAVGHSALTAHRGRAARTPRCAPMRARLAR